MNERIEQIKARLAKATAGQWEVTGLQPREVYITVDYKQTDDGRHQANWIAQIDDGDDDRDSETMYADAEFIANAPEDIAYLLAENARLRQALEDAPKKFTESLIEQFWGPDITQEAWDYATELRMVVYDDGLPSYDSETIYEVLERFSKVAESLAKGGDAE